MDGALMSEPILTQPDLSWIDESCTLSLPRSKRIEDFLKASNLDAILYIGESICDPDLHYLSGFLAFGRFTFLAAGKTVLLTSSMEQHRAQIESCANVVKSTSEYGIMERLKEAQRPEDAYISVLKDMLCELGIARIGIPRSFPASIYHELRKDLEVVIVDSPAQEWRAVKEPYELKAIVATQEACRHAMSTAIEMVKRSTIHKGCLYLKRAPLTSERVRSAIDIALLEKGCEGVDTIVAGGPVSANPHSRGTGILRAHQPIVIDIFPRSKKTWYFADMTRTVLRGEPPPEVSDMYEAVVAAQDAGLGAIRAGVSGVLVHEAVCRIFEDLGYPEREGRGFIHSTGHGVGLAVHERPSLSESGEMLTANNAVTVEPGLYYPEIGGVRLEDLVVVQPEGLRNLTCYERRLVL